MEMKVTSVKKKKTRRIECDALFLVERVLLLFIRTCLEFNHDVDVKFKRKLLYIQRCFMTRVFSYLGFVRSIIALARLSHSLWTTKPKNFYHPNQLSTRYVVESFNSIFTVPLGVVVQTSRLNFAIFF